MVLGDLNLLDDGDTGGKVAAASCSICLDLVTDKGGRSWAMLICGHQFHLDCIGSAFNVKGVMQCPNCRKIEKGQWLYANGNRPLHEFSVDDWAHDEDLYENMYSEMSFGVHWCPFGGLNRVPSSFDEPDVSPSAYHDHIIHPAFFADPTPVPSTIHSCPYVSYLGPIHPSSSTSSGTISNGSSFNTHWSNAPSEIPSTYAFPTMDAHYHSWDHSSSFVDQPSVTQRTTRNNSDITRQPGMHPYTIGLGSRGPTSATSSVVPPYPGTVSRPRERQPFFQQPNSIQAARNSLISNGRRNSNHMALAHVTTPVATSSDQSNGFYFFSPTSSSSGRAFQEAENPVLDSFHGWELDRDSIWGPFQTHENGNSVRQRQNRS